jgi:energy-coupling factor transporter ATP-binding protein EcfA2
MSDEMIHIKEVHVEGYKSIVNAKVEFLPGLNVIIGKNGAGKSNLLAAVEAVLLGTTRSLLAANVEILLSLPKTNQAEFKYIGIRRKKSLTPPDSIIFANSSEPTFAWSESDSKHLGGPPFSELISIKHSLPKDIPFLDSKLNLKVGKELNDLQDTLEKMTDPSIPYFCRAAIAQIHVAMLDGNLEWFLNPNIWEEEIRRIILSALGFEDFVMQNLVDHTPVEDVRLAQDFSLSKFGEQRFQINNIAYEFKIGDNWLPFDDLSDGTKRLIYILLSLGMPRRILPIEDGNGYFFQRHLPNLIVFLEEPELGIHPHQLHQLLQFLKAQARKHQIIITTHSPQVLDVLGREELDRIVIANYDSKEGSKFVHLNEKQRSKATAYLKDMLLSDYWRFSDLEPRANE